MRPGHHWLSEFGNAGNDTSCGDLKVDFALGVGGAGITHVTCSCVVNLLYNCTYTVRTVHFSTTKIFLVLNLVPDFTCSV